MEFDITETVKCQTVTDDQGNIKAGGAMEEVLQLIQEKEAQLEKMEVSETEANESNRAAPQVVDIRVMCQMFAELKQKITSVDEKLERVVKEDSSTKTQELQEAQKKSDDDISLITTQLSEFKNNYFDWRPRQDASSSW